MVENINTIYQNLPCSIGGFTMYDAADDYYTIVLNSRCSNFNNKKTFEHEIKHITNGDFLKLKKVAMLELMLH